MSRHVSEHQVTTLVVAVVTFAFSSVTLGYVWLEHTDPVSRAVAVVLVTAVYALQVGVISAGRWQGKRGTPGTAVAALAVLVLVPRVHYGYGWVALLGFLGASLLLLWPGRRGQFAVAGLALYAASYAAVTSGAPSEKWYTAAYAFVITGVTSIVFFGLSLLRAAAVDLDRTRAQLAEGVVATERAAVAERLHHAVTERLTEVQLRIGLARRLLDDSPALTVRQLGDVTAVSRIALADIRDFTRAEVDAGSSTTAIVVPVGASDHTAVTGRQILAASLAGYLVIDVIFALTATLSGADVWAALVVTALLLAAFVLQVVVATPVVGPLVDTGGVTPPRLSLGVIGSVLVLQGLLLVGAEHTIPQVTGSFGILAANLLLHLPRWVGPGLAAMLLGTYVVTATGGLEPFSVYLLGVTNLDRCLVTWGLAVLVTLIRQRERLRAELTDLAVAQERVRLARDLHDLLGYGLSAISLKTELAARLAGVDAARASRELDEISDLSKQCLADVRTVAADDTALDLVTELTSVTRGLRGTGLDVSARIDPDVAASRDAATLAAIVLREAAANVLRHASATSCDIAITQETAALRVEVDNDGAYPPTLSGTSGSGLANLAARLHSVGGTIATGPYPPDRFRLTARLPLAVPDERRGQRSPVDALPG